LAKLRTLANRHFAGNLIPGSRSYRRLPIPIAIDAAELLPDAASQA
jgi:hypothetical protein